MPKRRRFGVVTLSFLDNFLLLQMIEIYLKVGIRSCIAFIMAYN